jgi:hypothetical protein
MYRFEKQRSGAVAESRRPVQVDASLLSRYVEALGAIGWQPQGGLVRPVYSPCTGYLGHPVRHLTGHSTTEYRQGLERDP